MCNPADRCYKGKLVGGARDGHTVDVPGNCTVIVIDGDRYELEDGWPGPTSLPTYRLDGRPYSSTRGIIPVGEDKADA